MANDGSKPSLFRQPSFKIGFYGQRRRNNGFVQQRDTIAINSVSGIGVNRSGFSSLESKKPLLIHSSRPAGNEYPTLRTGTGALPQEQLIQLISHIRHCLENWDEKIARLLNIHNDNINDSKFVRILRRGLISIIDKAIGMHTCLDKFLEHADKIPSLILAAPLSSEDKSTREGYLACGSTKLEEMKKSAEEFSALFELIIEEKKQMLGKLQKKERCLKTMLGISRVSRVISLGVSVIAYIMMAVLGLFALESLMPHGFAIVGYLAGVPDKIYQPLKWVLEEREKVWEEQIKLINSFEGIINAMELESSPSELIEWLSGGIETFFREAHPVITQHHKDVAIASEDVKNKVNALKQAIQELRGHLSSSKLNAEKVKEEIEGVGTGKASPNPKWSCFPCCC